MSETWQTLRIGDRERDDAAERLREAHVAGRISSIEFDERLSAALTARTQQDLEPLFADLGTPQTPQPAPRPTEPAVRAAPRRRVPWPLLPAVVWPVTIALCLLIGNWSLIPIAIVLTVIAGHGGPCGRMRAGCGLTLRR